MTKEEIIKEKIIEILKEVMSASENRDWGREAHATKRELETMRNNNDNDFLQIADQIFGLLKKENQDLLEKIEADLEVFRKDYQGVWRNKNYQRDFNILIDKIKSLIKKLIK